MADRFPNRPSFADNFDAVLAAADAPSDSDPLAELARLIGRPIRSPPARGRQTNCRRGRAVATDFSSGAHP